MTPFSKKRTRNDLFPTDISRLAETLFARHAVTVPQHFWGFDRVPLRRGPKHHFALTARQQIAALDEQILTIFFVRKDSGYSSSTATTKPSQRAFGSLHRPIHRLARYSTSSFGHPDSEHQPTYRVISANHHAG